MLAELYKSTNLDLMLISKKKPNQSVERSRLEQLQIVMNDMIYMKYRTILWNVTIEAILRMDFITLAYNIK